MTKNSVVRVNSDYKIQTANSGTITLDTGAAVGYVIVTGNLTVQGTTTSIETVNTQITDNILLLNKGETGNGVSDIGRTSGIEIDRGVSPTGNAQILWNENYNWRKPTNTVNEEPAINSRSGLWVFQTMKNNISTLNAIMTDSIDTNGGNLALISKSTGIITVKGTTHYEEQVIRYDNVLEPLDDDIIPNIKAVVDKIAFEIINDPSDKIQRDNTEVRVYDYNISRRVTSFDTSGSPSTTVKVRHFLIKNHELNVKVTTYVKISNSNIPNLDGTWQVITADPMQEWFEINTASPVTADNIQSFNIQTGIRAIVHVLESKSNIRFTVDGRTYAELQNTHMDVFNVRIQDSTVQSTASNTDLILLSSGTGSVQIQDNLKMAHVGVAGGGVPAVANNNVKIYTNPEGPGNTGIYFVNPTFALNTGEYRRDELISKKKAIAFSILM